MSSASPPDDPDLRFRTLFEQAPFSVQLLAPDGRTLRVNKAWQRLWQDPPDGSLTAYVMTSYNVLQDEQLAAKGVTEPLRRAFAGESVELPTIVYEPTAAGKAGLPRWVKSHAHAIKDASGAVTEVMLIHEDVTDRVRSEQAIHASESRLKQLANTIPQLVWMADPGGTIHWYNERWYAYTGTTLEQMAGWGWHRVHDPLLLPRVVERWKQSLATGAPFQMTFPLRGKDGRFRPFFTLVAPLRDESGTIVQWFGSNTDVSALHDAQRGLRDAEERLRLATHAGQIGIWDWDLASDSVTWSDEVYLLHEMAPGSFGGRAQDFFERVHPDDRVRVQREVKAALASGDGLDAEFRIVLPGGGSKWLSTWATLHRDAQGHASRLVGATISIDAYKRAEADLRDSDRRKDEFLAMLAHELRNPLAPISTAAQLLRARLHSPDTVRQASEIISRQVTHITELVDDLLDVSRVTRGLIELDKMPVDLQSVLQSAIEQSRPSIEARGHRLDVQVPSQTARVLGDPTRLVQALVNLLNNAARYTASGGHIELSLALDDTQARIVVQDNGAGIDAALLPHIFDLFTQGARHPSRAEGGLGIGLALVRSIVAMHAGRIDAVSDGAGCGSRFTMTLPLHQEATPPSPQADACGAAAPQPSARSRRVMVVDDNVDAAESLAMLLELEGHRVVVHHAAEAALQAIDEFDAEVFILDIGLPDVDGYELARRLRERGIGARLIALTGYGQSQDRQRSAAAGFDLHLLKPLDAAVLLQALANGQ